MSVENASSVGSRLVTDEPMARHTWYRLGGPARYFLTPRNEAELGEVLVRCREHGLPVYVLGGGANLVIQTTGDPDDHFVNRVLVNDGLQILNQPVKRSHIQGCQAGCNLSRRVAQRQANPLAAIVNAEHSHAGNCRRGRQ